MLEKTPNPVPAEIQSLLGPPPLCDGEVASRYWQSVALVAAALQPHDIIDWLQVKDFTDDAWESLRLRRYKVPVMDLERKRALETVLRKLLNDKSPNCFKEAEQYADRWFADAEGRKEVTELLAKYGLDAECIAAQAFLLSEPSLQKMNQMIEAAEARRGRNLRQFAARQTRSTQEKTRSLTPTVGDAPPTSPAEVG